MKKGDEVKVRSDMNHIPFCYRGCEGIITANEIKKDICGDKQRYWIRIEKITGDIWFDEDEIYRVKNLEESVQKKGGHKHE